MASGVMFGSEPGSQLFGEQFQKDLVVQKGLKAKYFSGSGNCHILIDALYQSLKGKVPHAFINRSSSGSTGFTFLGQVPSHAIANEIPDQRIGIVIKWQSEGQCSVERIGSLFFKAFGFPAPETYRIDPKLANLLGPYAEKKCFAMGANYQSLGLIAMPQLDANNFKEASKSKIKQMSPEDQQVMLEKFGEIALLDIILGNNDRFVSFTDNVETLFSATSSFNSGNVMMEFDELESGHQKLVEVYPIDNCTLDMADKKKIISDSEEDMGFGFLEDDQFESSPDSPVSVESSSPRLDVPSIDTEFLFHAKIIRLNQVCIRLINDLDCVASHIRNNLVKDLKERIADIGEFEEFIDMAPKHLIIGMRKALDKARTFEYAPFIKQCEEEEIDAFSRRALMLIQINLQSIQQL